MQTGITSCGLKNLPFWIFWKEAKCSKRIWWLIWSHSGILTWRLIDHMNFLNPYEIFVSRSEQMFLKSVFPTRCWFLILRPSSLKTRAGVTLIPQSWFLLKTNFQNQFHRCCAAILPVCGAKSWFFKTTNPHRNPLQLSEVHIQILDGGSCALLRENLKTQLRCLILRLSWFCSWCRSWQFGPLSISL